MTSRGDYSIVQVRLVRDKSNSAHLTSHLVYQGVNYNRYKECELTKVANGKVYFPNVQIF